MTYRGAVFKNNKQRIDVHNADPSRTYDEGFNQFSDMTDEEFESTIFFNVGGMLMNIDVESVSVDPPAGAVAAASEIRASSASGSEVRVGVTAVDWTPKITAIRNQGSCGSCWAFSAIGLVEGGLKIKYAASYDLSEQEVVDCCRWGIASVCGSCIGCSGGIPEQALSFLNSYGSSYESSYPYKALAGTCQYNSKTHYKVLSTSWLTYVTTNNVASLQTAIAGRPVGLYVDANSWSRYATGIFTGCTLSKLNHAVIAVGFDASGNWKIRNSWGTSWGEAGYIRIANSGNPCGILNRPYYTTVV